MISFRVFLDLAIEKLDAIAMKQIPWATGKAMNAAGMKARDTVRAGMEQEVHLRRRAFELRQIEISQYANKRALTLVIQINPSAMNLIRLVRGFDHLPWIPLAGRDYLWIPNSEVFGDRVILPGNPLHPLNLRFGANAKWGGPLKGAERAFALMDNKKGIPVVFQRIASSNAKASRKKGVHEAKEERYKNTRLLYHLHDRQHTPVKLKFYEPISNTFFSTFQGAFKAFLAEGIATAK